MRKRNIHRLITIILICLNVFFATYSYYSRKVDFYLSLKGSFQTADTKVFIKDMKQLLEREDITNYNYSSLQFNIYIKSIENYDNFTKLFVDINKILNKSHIGTSVFIHHKLDSEKYDNTVILKKRNI